MRAYIVGAAAAALVLASAGSAVAAGTQFERSLSRSYSPQTVSRVEVSNLDGHVSVRRATGEIGVTVHVVADAGSATASQALAGQVRVRERRDGSRVILLVEYPLGDHDQYYYDPHPAHGRYRSSFYYDGRRVTVSGGGGQQGARLHADLDIALPQGTALRVVNHVGDIQARDLAGDVALKVHAGTIEAVGGSGRLTLDARSGSVRAAQHDGEVNADTGSGDVYFEQLKGPRIAADTGSGSVHIHAVDAGLIYADTGSGTVNLDHASGALEVDTGSGGVTAGDYTAGNEVHVDTGSGSVRLEGDLSAMRDLYIDTGSGGVHLLSSATPSMRLRVSTSSGGIDVDLPGMSDVRSSRGDFSAVLGSGAGKGLIDTGSGGVSFQAE